MGVVEVGVLVARTLFQNLVHSGFLESRLFFQILSVLGAFVGSEAGALEKSWP